MGYVRIMWVGANLLALIPLAPLLRSKDLRLGRLHAAIAFTIMFSELVSWLLFLGLSDFWKEFFLMDLSNRAVRPPASAVGRKSIA